MSQHAAFVTALRSELAEHGIDLVVANATGAPAWMLVVRDGRNRNHLLRALVARGTTCTEATRLDVLARVLRWARVHLAPGSTPPANDTPARLGAE